MHDGAASELKSSYLGSNNPSNLRYSLLDAMKNWGKNLVSCHFPALCDFTRFFPNCNLLRVKARCERENGSNPFSTEVCLRLHRVILMMAFLTMGAVISIEEIFKCSHMKTTAAVED